MYQRMLIIFLFLFMQESLFAEAPLQQTKGVLEKLLEGNVRYINQKLELCLNTATSREGSSSKQKPIAAIVCCSDSRVPPEIIFDQAIGSLFVTRLAGNLVDNFSYGSLEYAVKNLGVSFIMVLGHERCGVMETFLKTLKEKQYLEGHIEELVLAVYPAIQDVKDINNYTVDDLVKKNVLHIVHALKETAPILSEKYAGGQLEIVGAFYDLSTGKVSVLK
ncbi:MAG: carbonic anhydrase [Chlamydiales bacterium]|nr:carbonic anhydrase [Chlamydiales bacterium]